MNTEALQRARNSLPEGVFDSLPDVAKQSIIAMQQQLIDQHQQLIEAEPIMERHRIFQQQEQRRQRNLEVSRQQLRDSGIAERVGYDMTPVRFNRVEEDHIDVSCEFPYNEPNAISYIGGLIHGFQRCTIEALAEQAQSILDRARSHKHVQRSAHAYMLFHIWTGSQQRVGTKPVIIGDIVKLYIDDLYNNLHQLLSDIENKAGAYESIYSGDQHNFIHFYFKANYFPPPKSIYNWGTNIKQIEHKQHFDIFTANDPNVNCIVQVAQRLFGNDAKQATIEDIIKTCNQQVCIVKPHSGINNIQQINSYYDLIVEPLSPIKSLSVIDANITYLLHFNEHLGLMENVKQPKRHVYYTSFRPVAKYPNTSKITMCFDIECYFDAKADQRHIPYLCCACFVYDDTPGNVLEFEGKDCIAQMIEYAADTVKDFKLDSIELIAHNGGGYDFHYILTAMYDPSIVKDILIRNNHFISFKFKHHGITFNVKDSYNFLCCSLQNAAKAFLGSADKTDFPHHEVRTKADLAKVYQQWISIDRQVTVNVEKEKMMISSEHVVNYKHNGDSKKLIEWAKTYCINDVIVLAKVWIKFKQTVSDVFHCHIVDQTLTLAGMSFRLFEAHLPAMYHGNNVKLHHPNKADYMNMRKSLVGGRCVSINGIYENIVCLDVKSLYPAAMAYYEQPYGSYRLVTSEIKGELGIFYCKVIPCSNVTNHGFFPLRYNDNVYYNGVKEEYKAWYTSVDIAIGREEGHTIMVIAFKDNYVGYSWKHKGLIFKEYIENVLYKLKLHYEQNDQKEHRWIIKIVMNSLWGKFAQKWMDSSYKIIHEHDVDETDDAYKLFDTDYMLVKNYKNSVQSSKPIQNGIFTLSYARYHMYKLWNKIAKPHAVCIYSDTDSMMVNEHDIDKEAMIELNNNTIAAIGNEMGQLEIEATFDEFITVGKKQYIGQYGQLHNAMYKKRFKGVPLQYITPSLFTHLIKSKDHTAQISFLKFKRQWGCIHGYMESKTVKQT